MKQFVRDHFEDFVNKRKAAVIRKNMTLDFYDHDGPGGKPTGADGDEQMMIVTQKSMPDLRVTIEEMIAVVDRRFLWQKDAVSWLCAVALRGEQNRRALGYSYGPRRGDVVTKWGIVVR